MFIKVYKRFIAVHKKPAIVGKFARSLLETVKSS